ncbi:amidohydrolase family protein [Halovulum sp. GXIMD14793]
MAAAGQSVLSVRNWLKAIGGWSPHQFEEGRYPTMEELNAAVPDHPFMVQHAYNVAFLNEQALAILQEHAPFVFTHVPQTRWETDADGNYTGAVYGEPASWIFWILEAIVPQTQGEETTRSMQHMFRDMNRFGITLNRFQLGDDCLDQCRLHVAMYRQQTQQLYCW